jgi:hypothetical protein
MDSKIIVRARLHSSIRNSGPVSFAISIDCSTTVRAVKELLLQKARKAPGAPEWNAPSSPSAFIMRLNDTVPLVNEDVLVIDRACCLRIALASFAREFHISQMITAGIFTSMFTNNLTFPRFYSYLQCCSTPKCARFQCKRRRRRLILSKKLQALPLMSPAPKVRRKSS